MLQRNLKITLSILSGILLGTNTASAQLFHYAHFSIVPLNSQLQTQIQNAKMWQPGCPVKLEDLRLLNISYYDFLGTAHSNGELILNQQTAPAALKVFEKLYQLKFPLTAIDSLINLKGNWQAAQQQNISYGFICSEDSKGNYIASSYGNVITFNPVQNPAITLKQVVLNDKQSFLCRIFHDHLGCKADMEIDDELVVTPTAGFINVNRSHAQAGEAENVIEIFSKQNFLWSGNSIQAINWGQFTYQEQTHADK